MIGPWCHVIKDRQVMLEARTEITVHVMLRDVWCQTSSDIYTANYQVAKGAGTWLAECSKPTLAPYTLQLSCFSIE